MEPIEESLRAAAELEPDVDDVALLAELRSHSERVVELVPECVGMSVARRDLGVTLALVATSRAHEAAGDGEVPADTTDDLLNETSWQLLALGAAAAGVASTLTLPVIVDDVVTGSVNLYATTPHAFDHHHGALASVLGAWAAGATTNADLSFSSLGAAREAPRILADRATLETAVGLVMAAAHVSVDEGYQRLRDAAHRAGVSEVQAAEAVVTAARDHGTGASGAWPFG